MSPKTNPAVKDDLAQSDKPLASQDYSPAANVDLSQEIRLMFAEMRTKFAKMDAKMEIKFAEMKAEMEIKFAKLETEMRTKFAKVETEFAVVKREIKAIDTKLDGQIKEFNNLRQRVDAKELTQGRLIVSIILVILGSATTIIAQRILPGLGQ